jgi:hypothetical protein
MLTWSPYAFVTLYSAFVNPDHITPVGSTLPAIFAKSSTVWSTIFYIFSNKNIKSKMILKPSSTDRIPTIHRQILQKITINENKRFVSTSV